jgi:type III restriction enzyme
MTYKFDSSTELDFAFLLEYDSDVLKWIRPVPNQFKIYWANGAHQYEPDFVAETESTIYMIETKADKNIEDEDVQSKKEAAERYCQIVTEYTLKNGGKPWQYVIIGESDFEKTHQLKYVLSKL